MKIQLSTGAEKALAEAGSGVRGSLCGLLDGFPPEKTALLAPCRRRAGEILINMQEPADSVYILLRGEVSGINEQTSGMIYRFAYFSAPFIFGEFEAFSGCPVYRSTLVCGTDCVFLRMPREAYLGWMRRDSAALFSRTCAITSSLLEQARNERSRLFCSGTQRLAMFIASCCRGRERDGAFRLSLSMQAMADGIGGSTKTVQRALAKLEESGAVTRAGRTMTVSEKQYAMLLAMSDPENENISRSGNDDKER